MVATLAPSSGSGAPVVATLSVVVVSTNRRPTPALQYVLDVLTAQVTFVAHPSEAFDLFNKERVDLVFLLIGRGWDSQLRRCRLLREASEAPIIVLGEQGATEERLRFFAAGADDVLELGTAPPAEVEPRFRAMVRLYRGGSPGGVFNGPSGLVLDISGRTAFVHGTEVPLTPGEYELLALLLERRGRAVPVSVIGAHVSSGDFTGRRNYLEAMVSRLRGKLRAAGTDGVVETVRQVGYRVG